MTVRKSRCCEVLIQCRGLTIFRIKICLTNFPVVIAFYPSENSTASVSHRTPDQTGIIIVAIGIMETSLNFIMDINLNSFLRYLGK